MKTSILLGPVVISWFLLPQCVQAVSPTAAEIEQARQWMAARFETGHGAEDVGPFFSFTYGGKPSTELLKTWKLERASRRLDDQRTERTLAFTDPKTGLVVRCRRRRVQRFSDRRMDAALQERGNRRHARSLPTSRPSMPPSSARATASSPCTRSRATRAWPTVFSRFQNGSARRLRNKLRPVGGRPTNGAAPYWNFETAGKGFIVALGWPGQWAAQFDRDDGKTLRIRAGQELTHFKLHPGEEVRSPLVALQFYCGDWIRGQNLWRRWMVAHNIPRPGGKLVPTHYGACWSNDLHPRADTEMAILNGYLREKIPLGFYFIDAGWYPSKRDWWTDAGTWEVDKERFPKGIREVSDLAHANGMKFVLWFEPERAGPGTWLSENHPEWILGGRSGGLVNLGNRDAWKWIVDRIDSLIKSEGVDVYRQDFNIDPLGYWRGADAAGPAGHHRKQARRRLLGLLGRTASAEIPGYGSIPAPAADGATIWKRCDGQCRCCAAIAYRIAHQPAVPYLRTVALDAVPRLGHDRADALLVPQHASSPRRASAGTRERKTSITPCSAG